MTMSTDTTESSSSTGVEKPLKLVASVAPHASLEDIKMTGGVFGVEQRSADDVKEERELRPEFGHSITESKLVVDLHLEIRFPLNEEEGDDYLHIVGNFHIEYGISGDADLSEQAIGAFARINGLYNVWPYWREYTHQVTTRMGLQFSPMPLLTIGRALQLLDYGN